jgi:hypothetical protein
MNAAPPPRTGTGRPIRPLASRRRAALFELQRLRQFLCECTLRTLGPAGASVLRAGAAIVAIGSLRGWRTGRWRTGKWRTGKWRTGRWRTWRSTSASTGARSGPGDTALRLWRLSGIRAQQALFERRTIETPDDGIHLFLIRRFDEGETLRFLSFGVTDHFDVIGHEVVCGEPRLDIVGGHPQREISEENGITHPIVQLTPFGMLGKGFGGLIHGSTFIVAQALVRLNPKSGVSCRNLANYRYSRA